MSRLPEARSRFLKANRLKLHLLEWGEDGPVVLLLHGFLEHAHGWHFIGPQLAAAGFHVFALDWRGHGDSDWVGAGGYYHFFDYIADLTALCPQLGERVALVAHSMGGGAALMYAGTQPHTVSALVSIEGLGVPDFDPMQVPERVLSWLDDLRRVGQRSTPTFQLDAAVRRVCERNPRFSEEIGRHMVTHGTRAVDGGLQWKFDPLHQTRSPQPTYVAQARAFWQRVTCPVLYIEGSESMLRLPPPDLEERLHALCAERVVIDGAGHHPHLEQPAILAPILIDFLNRATGAAGST